LWDSVVASGPGVRAALEKLAGPLGGPPAAASGARHLVPLRLLLLASPTGGDGAAERRDATQRFVQVPLPAADAALTLRRALDAVYVASQPNPSAAQPPKRWTDVLVQGVRPPLDAPLQAVCAEMCAHDLHLYVVARCEV